MLDQRNAASGDTLIVDLVMPKQFLISDALRSWIIEDRKKSRKHRAVHTIEKFAASCLRLLLIRQRKPLAGKIRRKHSREHFRGGLTGEQHRAGVIRIENRRRSSTRAMAIFEF